MVVTIEEGAIKTIKKRFRGLDMDYVDVSAICESFGYCLDESISDAATFLISREIERILVEKLVTFERDVVYIVPKYSPDIKKTVADILRRNCIDADLVVGLLML